MTKKQKQEEKKKEKLLKKQELADIIEKHLVVCMKDVDDAYSEVLMNLDNANSELLEMSNYLTQERQELQKAIKEGNMTTINNLMSNSYNTTDKFVNRFTKLTIPKKYNSITAPLAEGGKKSSDYLNRLQYNLELEGNKNATYIASTIYNKLVAKSKEYSDIVCKDFYKCNPYIEMFNSSIDLYRDTVLQLENTLNESGFFDEEEEEIVEGIKVNSGSRLRCTHTDMMNFAKEKGYEEVRQAGSTHRIWRHSETGVSLPIPAKYGRSMPQGTMSRMLRQMGLKRQDLLEFLRTQ